MKYEVIMVPWTAYDSWSGNESAGVSLHLTQADHDAYMEEASKGRPRTAPEYYEQPDGDPIKLMVNDEIYQKIKASKNGIRYYEKLSMIREIK